MYALWLQVASIAYATQSLFLGSEVINTSGLLDDSLPAGLHSFLKFDDNQFAWRNVLQGIEEMSHNITAALLALSLGMMDAECFIDQPFVIYQYSSFALWIPYGVSNFSLLSCYDLTFSHYVL